MASEHGGQPEKDLATGRETDKQDKKKGLSLFALLKESLTKTTEGCGPGCGCHVDQEKDREAAGDDTGK